MIKLFSVKEKQKQDAAAAAAGKPKQSAGELRVQKGACSVFVERERTPFFSQFRERLCVRKAADPPLRTHAPSSQSCKPRVAAAAPCESRRRRSQ